MAGRKVLGLLPFILGLSKIIASNLENKCEYDLINSLSKHSLNFSVDAELVYRIYEAQNGCEINVDEIYKNVTKLLKVNRTEVYISLGFSCEASAGSSDIHFIFSGTEGKFDELRISVQIILSVCSVYMDELTYFQQYGHIWSVVTTKVSHIHPGVSCSSLKDLRMLSSSIPCTDDNYNETTNAIRSFFWEACDPFEQLFNLRLQGCATNPYKLKNAFIEGKFPKLQTLWVKYINFSSSRMTFPWTNVYIHSSDSDIIKYLSYYEEKETKNNDSIARSINIYDSTIRFGSDVSLAGYIDKIVINNVKITKLDTIFTKIRGLEILDLSNNEIQQVDRNAFRVQRKLLKLNLANNKLITLPDEVFDSLQYLLYLDLSSNRIVTIKQRYFKYLLKLEELTLDNNDIKTLPNNFLESQVNSIQYVLLSKNPLYTIPLNAFYASNILLVDMQYCQINSSSLLSVLENINLYEMQTAFTQSQILQPVHMRTFDLSKNKITDIPIDLWKTAAVTKFKSVIQSFYINFKDNPLDCTCKILLTATLADSYVKQGLYIDWKCQSPLELRGRLISTIEPKETYCSTDIKHCPVRCHCFIRFGTRYFIPDSERTFIIDCRNINMTFLPLLMPPGRLELWFKNSSLIEITGRDYLKNVINLDISQNRINQITFNTARALTNISILKLDHNNLTHLPEQLSKKNFSLVTLSSNPFICDCKTKWMKSWLLKQTNPVKDWRDIECTYNSTSIWQMIALQDSKFVCKEHSKDFRLHEHVIFPSIIIGSVLFVLVSVTMLVIFNRFTIKVLLFLYFGFRPFDKSVKCHKNTSYDAFVLYSYADREFIRLNLIERLRNKDFRVVDLYTDLIVGFSFLQNIEIFIKRSKRIIFCWTGDMLENDLIVSAWNMAYERAVKYDLDLLILVADSDLKTEFCANDNLKNFFKRGKYIKKHAKYMFASVEYLIPRINLNVKFNISTEESDNEERSDIPMLAALTGSVNYLENDLIYVSYPEDLDMEIRLELIPYLLEKGRNVRVLEHDITPGADIRDEIHTKLDNSTHFVFIVSNSVFNDDVKMFILTSVMSKSKLQNKNYLLLFTSGNLYDAYCTNELNNYFNNFVTASTADENFRSRLLQALEQKCDEVQE